MMSTRNILYLFESAVGIGHQRRASGIINGLIAIGFDVFVASGTFVDPENYFDPRAKLIKLPEPRRRKNGVMSYYDTNNVRVTDLEYNFENWKKKRVIAISPILETNLFDAVMLEWWPFQRRSDFDSIVDSIAEIQQAKFGKKPMIVSSLRDVIETDNQELLDTNGQKEKTAVEMINSLVDLILVHGDQDFVPFHQGSIKEAIIIRKPVIYTGYVVNESAKTCGAQQRKNMVIVSCGSGHDGHYMMNATLSAMPFSNIADHEWHFVLGPRMQPAEKRHFRFSVKESLLKNPAFKIVVHDQLAQLPQTLSHAALSISLSGYNTTMEVLASQIPSVLIPKFTECGGKITKIEGEQWERLLLIQERKMAVIAHPSDVLDAEKFAQIIDHAHINGVQATHLDMDGIRFTAVLMTKLFPPIPQRLGKIRCVIKGSSVRWVDFSIRISAGLYFHKKSPALKSRAKYQYKTAIDLA